MEKYLFKLNFNIIRCPWNFVIPGYKQNNASVLVNNLHRRQSRGQLPLTCRQGRGANGIKCPPPPFRRLNGMMLASMEKTQAYIGENV